MPRRRHHDLHVPLLPPRRGTQAYAHRTRLRRLGHDGVAFTHAAYGRLRPDRDDADITLPWGDLLSEGGSSAVDGADASGAGGEDSLGRTDASGTKVYRRLNVVVEEVGDATRLLLPAADDFAAVASLLHKYDVVSVQPMNEPALKAVCELLSTSDSGSSPSSSNSNTNCIDVITLEYATGSRGGHGTPYKLRKDYVERAMRAGVTFEICYGAAVLDPKRRQGFLRTLSEFKLAWNGIQKKRALLIIQSKRKGFRGEKLPLLLSSGQRQNYTQGSGDEGTVAFRSPDDVRFMVDHMGGDHASSDGGVVNSDEYEMNFDERSENGHDSNEREKPTKRKKGRQPVVVVENAAERVLARATDRALGAVNMTRNKRRSGHETRSSIVQRPRCNAKDSAEDEEEDADDDVPWTNIVSWLSKPLCNKASAKETGRSNNEPEPLGQGETPTESIIRQNEEAPEIGEPSKLEEDTVRISPKEEGEDMEDGFIAF